MGSDSQLASGKNVWGNVGGQNCLKKLSEVRNVGRKLSGRHV